MTAGPGFLESSEKPGLLRHASPVLGRFEGANSEPFFWTKVGDLPLDIQIALLPVLQEREIERVGSDRQPVDVRVPTTHRDLDKLVSEGKFRQDPSTS